MPLILESLLVTGEVVYIFNNFPLPSHAQAMVSAEAAECAGLQDKFWEMHDVIFDNQEAWSGNTGALNILLGYGADLGLDSTAFQACMSEHQTAEKIEQQRAYGQAIGVPATPAFLVRAKGSSTMYPIVGAYPFEEFEKAIQTVTSGG